MSKSTTLSFTVPDELKLKLNAITHGSGISEEIKEND